MTVKEMVNYLKNFDQESNFVICLANMEDGKSPLYIHAIYPTKEVPGVIVEYTESETLLRNYKVLDEQITLDELLPQKI